MKAEVTRGSWGKGDVGSKRTCQCLSEASRPKERGLRDTCQSTSSRFLDIFQIVFDQWRHLGGMPIGVFGILRPGKWKMKNFPWPTGIFKH